MIYNIDGNELTSVYDLNGAELQKAYDIKGSVIFEKNPTPDPYRPNRLLLFEEDFSGNDIDDNCWTVEVGHNGGKAYQTKRRQNAFVQNGHYIAMMKKEDYLDKYTWTAGGITTRAKKTWIYGRFEAKMKVSEAFNSAFWLIGNNFRLIYPTNDDESSDYRTFNAPSQYAYNWPECGEIDIVESWNYGQKAQPQCNLWSYTGTSISHGTFPTPMDTVNEWHIYAVERTRDLIVAYIDDIEYHRWNLNQLNSDVVKAYIDMPFSIILGIGIGDSSDEKRMSEARMMVDWVRVYAPEGVNEQILPESVTMQESIRLKKGYATYMVCHVLPGSTTNLDVTWSSDNENICRVINGTIYCDGIGETDVHVTTVNGLTATCHVTVVNPEDY